MAEQKNVLSHLKNPETWVRLIYMLIFSLLLALVKTVVWVIAALQFLLVLFTGRDNPHLRDLGQGVAKWTLQATLFLSYNSEEKPFPFADWPEIETLPEVEPEQKPATVDVAKDASEPAQQKASDNAAENPQLESEKQESEKGIALDQPSSKEDKPAAETVDKDATDKDKQA